MVDATAQPLLAALADGLDHLRSEIASLQQRVDVESAARSENQAGTRPEGGGAGGPGRRPSRGRARGETGPESSSKSGASLVAMVDATAQPLHAALADRLDHVRWEIASLAAARRPRVGGPLRDTRLASTRSWGSWRPRSPPSPAPSSRRNWRRSSPRSGPAWPPWSTPRHSPSTPPSPTSASGSTICSSEMASLQQRVDHESAARSDQGDLDQDTRARRRWRPSGADLAATMDAPSKPGFPNCCGGRSRLSSNGAGTSSPRSPQYWRLSARTSPRRCAMSLTRR